MKTIEFEGRKYEVEDWVNWVAMDSDGEIFGYESKPEIDDNGGSYFVCSFGPYCEARLIKGNWQDSLTKV